MFLRVVLSYSTSDITYGWNMLRTTMPVKKRKPIVKLLHIRLSNQRKPSAFIALPETEKVELWEKETTEK